MMSRVTIWAEGNKIIHVVFATRGDRVEVMHFEQHLWASWICALVARFYKQGCSQRVRYLLTFVGHQCLDEQSISSLLPAPHHISRFYFLPSSVVDLIPIVPFLAEIRTIPGGIL